MRLRHRVVPATAPHRTVALSCRSAPPLTAMCSVDRPMAATKLGKGSTSRPGCGAGALRRATSHRCSPSSKRLSSSGWLGSVQLGGEAAGRAGVSNHPPKKLHLGHAGRQGNHGPHNPLFCGAPTDLPPHLNPSPPVQNLMMGRTRG